MKSPLLFPFWEWTGGLHTFFANVPRPSSSIVFATLVLKEEEIKLWPLTVKACGWLHTSCGYSPPGGMLELLIFLDRLVQKYMAKLSPFIESTKPLMWSLV